MIRIIGRNEAYLLANFLLAPCASLLVRSHGDTVVVLVLWGKIGLHINELRRS